MSLLIYTNNYLARRERIIIPRSIWADPDDLEYAMGYTVIPASGGDPAYPNLNLATGVLGFPSEPVASSLSALPLKINRAASPNVDTSFEYYGTLTPVEPGREVEVCALANVKLWRIAGGIEGKTFDYLVPAGVARIYEDDEQTSTTATPAVRSIYATGLRAFLSALGEEDDPAEIRVGIGRGPYFSGSSVGEPIEAMHTSPSSLINMPILHVTMLTSGKRVGTVGGSSGIREPGTADLNILFLGRAVQTATPFDNPPDDYSLSITAEEFWGPGEWE